MVDARAKDVDGLVAWMGRVRRFEVGVCDPSSPRAVSRRMLANNDDHGIVSRRLIDGGMARRTVCRVAT